MKIKGKTATTVLSAIGIVLVLGIIFFVVLGSTNGNKENSNTTNIDLPELKIGETIQYESEKCGVTFSYPSEWEISENKLPLNKKPLEMVLFDAPKADSEEIVKSALVFMCFDENKVSFSDLYPETSKTPEKEHIGNTAWSRIDSFAFTKRGGKLIVFQMNNTKYDIMQNASYEKIFSAVLGSVK